MASKVLRRALGLKDNTGGVSTVDRETLEERCRTLEAVKAELVKQERQIQDNIEAYERQPPSTVQQYGVNLEEKAALVRMAKSRSSSGGRGGELEGQQLELDMNLVIKQLQRSEDKVVKEAREWEAKAKDRAEAEGKMKRKLASYPRRFLQSADEVSREVRQLEQQRDALETEAKEERAALFESIHSLRTELSVRDTELRRVEKEVVEVEGDRTFWMNRFQKEKLRTDVLERTRQSLLARVRAFHEGKGLEKVVYDRAMLATKERGGEGGVEGFAKALGAVLAPLLEPEVTVDADELLEYVREAAAREKGKQGLLSFEGLCDVVARVEGKHWETSS